MREGGDKTERYGREERKEIKMKWWKESEGESFS